jgi:hypothetical protein
VKSPHYRRRARFLLGASRFVFSVACLFLHCTSSNEGLQSITCEYLGKATPLVLRPLVEENKLVLRLWSS